MNTPRIPTLTLTLLLGAGILGVGALRGDQATTRPDAASTPVSATTPLEYKVISGFKQPFNDDLHSHLASGWQPCGGISVTSWNNDLYFAQLISRPGTH